MRNRMHSPTITNSDWNKDELPDQWKESNVPIYKNDNKSDFSNFHRISLLSIEYKIVSTILLPMLSPYIDEIIGDHLRGF
jgi:hypothetical protein